LQLSAGAKVTLRFCSVSACVEPSVKKTSFAAPQGLGNIAVAVIAVPLATPATIVSWFPFSAAPTFAKVIAWPTFASSCTLVPPPPSALPAGTDEVTVMLFVPSGAFSFIW